MSKTCGAEYQCGFSKMRRGKKKPKRRSSVIKGRGQCSDRQVKSTERGGRGGAAKRGSEFEEKILEKLQKEVARVVAAALR